MRYMLTVLFILIAGSAAAHPGHLIEIAGHDHWVGGAAIGIAILAGLWGVIKGKEAEADDQDEEMEEEAA